MESKRSKIMEWYKNKSIFLTGGSGFMGKVMLEKLLYACDGIKNIYILLRIKKGRTQQQRIEDMWKLPIFDRLKKKDPNAIKKVIPINGDLYVEGLGLNQADLNILIENVSVVFHLGATLRLEANLKDAIEQNTRGTATVLDIAKKMKNLKAFCHFSTAFCSPDLEVFEERVYDSKDNPRDVIELVRWMDPSALDIATKSIIKPHVNTYTYSKRLAESLVASEKDNLPVLIIRPSIVSPAVQEPLPGWVDTLNGPMGLLVAAGKGVLRSMYCLGENKAQVIPVDYAINASIVATYKLATDKKSPEVPVYNLTQDGVISITIAEIIDKGRKVIYDNPFEMQVWYPDGDIRSSKLLHNICCIFMHWLPAIFIDLLMFILMQKRFMIRIQKKIHQGLELLEFFSGRAWNFKNEKFLTMWDEMEDIDKKLFSMDFTAMPIESYLKTSLLGTRQYCMKEPLSSLPRCRAQQKVLYVLHTVLKFTVYYYMFYLLTLVFPPVKLLYNYLWEIIAAIPIIGSLVSLR